MSFVHYLRMVLWSFFGIRRRAGADAEFQRVRPVLLIATALLAALCFVGLLVVVALLAAGPAHAAPATLSRAELTERTRACTACHGDADRATPHGYFPRIAGKPAGYLFNQLVNFRDGRRVDPTMSALVEHLSDDYLRQMAGHFAAQGHGAPPKAADTARTAHPGERLAREGDASRGVPACAACHGTSLAGVAPAVPGLLGLPRDYLLSQLGAWRTGRRHAQAPDCMADVARRLGADDIAAVSSWLAAQPAGAVEPAPGPVQVESLRACGSGR